MREGMIFSNQDIATAPIADLEPGSDHSGMARRQGECPGVTHGPEIKALRRGGRAGPASIAGLKRAADGLGVEFALPDRNQSARDIANHVVQERVGGRLDEDKVALTSDEERI